MLRLTAVGVNGERLVSSSATAQPMAAMIRSGGRPADRLDSVAMLVSAAVGPLDGCPAASYLPYTRTGT
jgi:hypothetical protein